MILSLLALAGFSGCKRLDYCLWELRDGIAACMQHSLQRLDSRGSGQWVIASLASFQPCCSHMSLCILSPKTGSWRSRQCCYCYRTSLVKGSEIVLSQTSAFFRDFCFHTSASNELHRTEYQCENLGPNCALTYLNKATDSSNHVSG